jgi:adenine phosphoribosyltransferase
MDFKPYIRAVPDFPKPGILFRDITPLLANPTAWQGTVQALSQQIQVFQPDFLVGIESRGFIFASALAHALGTGLVLVRKPGKLPCAVFQQTYALEYGQDTLEIHQDCFVAKPGGRVVIVDDVIATGGTAKAAAQLVTQAGGTLVGFSFLIELDFLKGRAQLPEAIPVRSLVNF